MNKHEVKTQSELHAINATAFCVYKTVLHHQNEEFVYYGKQSYKDAPDSRYIGSGRKLKSLLSKMSDSDTIEKTIVQSFSDENSAFELERDLINDQRKYDKEHLLNIHGGRSGGNRLSAMSPEKLKERNEKISASQIGRKFSPETIEKMRQAKLGKKHSAETKKKIAEAMTKH